MGIIGTFFDVFWSIKFNFVVEFCVSSSLQRETKKNEQISSNKSYIVSNDSTESFENKLFLIENNFKSVYSDH